MKNTGVQAKAPSGVAASAKAAAQAMDLAIAFRALLTVSAPQRLSA
jgi:hypothetical protein